MSNPPRVTSLFRNGCYWLAVFPLRQRRVSPCHALKRLHSRRGYNCFQVRVLIAVPGLDLRLAATIGPTLWPLSISLQIMTTSRLREQGTINCDVARYTHRRCLESEC